MLIPHNVYKTIFNNISIINQLYMSMYDAVKILEKDVNNENAAIMVNAYNSIEEETNKLNEILKQSISNMVKLLSEQEVVDIAVSEDENGLVFNL